MSCRMLTRNIYWGHSEPSVAPLIDKIGKVHGPDDSTARTETCHQRRQSSKGRIMEIKAWIQMGCERREVTFEVSDAERLEAGEDGLEMYIEDTVLDWIQCRYGWGWTCEMIKNDFSFMEDSESSRLVVTNEVLNPRTERLLVHPRAGRGRPTGWCQGRERSQRWRSPNTKPKEVWQ